MIKYDVVVHGKWVKDEDEEVDNIGYLVDMCDIYTKLKDASEEVGV